MLYSTKQDDVLDEICFKHYGFTCEIVEKVLSLNPHLADKGTHYEIGISIFLPPLTKDDLQKPKDEISLWD